MQQQNQIEILKTKLEETVDNRVRDTVTPEPENKTDNSFFPTANDTPRKLALKRKIQEMEDINVVQSKKIRKLQLQNQYQKRKILNMKGVMNILKENKLLQEQETEMLFKKFGNNDFFKHLFGENGRKTRVNEYSENIRKFAVSLHFLSPKAYNFVREKLNGNLPHPKTISKWYCNVDAAPGFSKEAFEMIQTRVKYSRKEKILCSLVFDEMAIRKYVEWDGHQYYGFVDLGTGISSESMGLASQVLTFMLVSVNESWKIPLGYFFINSLSSTKKAELLNQCFNLLFECDISVTNITFDGAQTNFSICKILGCNLDVDNLHTEMNNGVFIFPDPSHMIKLVRNLLGEKMVLYDENNNEINFKYLKLLNELQENEGLHLANKLRTKHILFFKQKMKTKLATQLFSESVAEAMLFCKEHLQLKEFTNCDATVKFILMMNNIFDILNSRSVEASKYKKAMCNENITEIKTFYNNFVDFAKGLKLTDGTPILQSQRKIGFLGLIIGLKSAICLFERYVGINEPSFTFIPLYKLGQDHIELFFGKIRSHCGNNDNPTVRNFIAAYKKLLVYCELKDNDLGNCIPLEEISILTCNSTVNKKPEKTIVNNENTKPAVKTSISTNCALTDHNYIYDYNISEFAKNIVVYISGFVCKKLNDKLKCQECSSELITQKENVPYSFVHFKNDPNFIYPSHDVVFLCTEAEKIIQRNTQTNTFPNSSIKNNILNEISVITKTRKVFQGVNEKHHTHSISENYELQLIKEIIIKYIDLRLRYACKQMSAKDSIRNYFKKIVLFKGQ